MERNRVFYRVPQITTLLMAIATVVMLSSTTFAAKQKGDDTAQLAKKLEKHVRVLSEDFHPRDRFHIENQTKCVKYIVEHFKKAGCKVTTQEVRYGGRTYQNVIARLGDDDAPRLVVGAHFDTVTTSPGADDNASSVAGLIELAYLLGQQTRDSKPKISFELVAYTLEESRHIGSMTHAGSLCAKKVDVAGMLSLDMIGYFSDEPGSQEYPLESLKKTYPDRGNFIAVVGRDDQKEFIEPFSKSMQEYPGIKTYSLAGPIFMFDVWRSDHASFWLFGWNAVMITDTANLRNKHYHQPTDTADRLDYQKMAHVVLALRKALVDFKVR